jgi:hypothetical protein
MDLEIDAGRQAFACGSDSFSERSTLLVFADPNMPQLAMLDELSLGNRIVVSDSAAAFSKAAPDATVILNWSGSCALLREVFLACPHLRWVHSRSAGLERSLFAELIEGPVLLTNGSGVFSASLGEFAL